MKQLYFVFFLFLISSIQAQSPIHSYDFSGTLAETGGSGPTLVANGGGGSFVTNTVCGVSKQVYQFAAGQGLDYNVGATFTNTYSLETVFRFNAVAGFARVLDYKNLTLDDGLYVVGGNLNFYPVASGVGAPIAANAFVHVVLTRNAAGTVTVYVNGCQHFSFADAGNRAITDAINKVVFFKDNGGENSAGAVSEIHVFDVELTAAQVTARYNTFCPPPPAPPQVVYEYLFDNNFLESSGKPGSLVPLGTGSFSNEAFSNCGNKNVYNFDINSGVQFDNTAASNFFGSEYTIELYFKFQNLSSWRRIVEYKNRSSDTGPYAFNNQIQFYNIITSGTFPFVVNTYAHVVFTRQANTACAGSNTFNMYVDGTLRATFNDAGNLGTLDAANLLSFFRDDLVVPNEASAGTIALLRLYNYVLLPSDVSTLFSNIPCPVLLSDPNTTLSAVRQEKNVLTSWDNARIPAQATYKLERSYDGISWEIISPVLPQNQLTYTDVNPSSQSSYYRLKINWDGQFVYSNLVAVPPYSSEDFVIYPNPIQRGQILTINADYGQSPIRIELYNTLGQLVFETSVQGDKIYSFTMPNLVPGIYEIKVAPKGWGGVRYQKLMVR